MKNILYKHMLKAMEKSYLPVTWMFVLVCVMVAIYVLGRVSLWIMRGKFNN